MVPLPLGLGLYPPDPEEAARIPRRAQVEDVLLERGRLPPNHLYVGQGRGSHRLAKTKWASPVVPGLNSQSNDWLWHYVAHIFDSKLVDDLHELHGQVLVCDCPFCDPCEADVLAGLCFEASHPGGQAMQRFSRGGAPSDYGQYAWLSARHPSLAGTLVEPGSDHFSLPQAISSTLL